MRGLILAFCLALCAPAAAGAEAGETLVSDAIRVAGDKSRVRIVAEFSQSPDLRWYLLSAPHRLVLDLPATTFRISGDDAAPRGLVTDLRFGAAGETRSRIVVTGDGPFLIERAEILKNETSPGYRLVADLVAASQGEFEAALTDQITTTASAADAEASRFTIVLDPGHGGVDSGARGVSGTLEKTITLAFGLELKKALEDTGLYDVFLTRDRDLFLRLDERVQIARRHGADLFISIHADAIRHRNVRGATVYTVSDSASDAESAAKAIRENLSDQLAGSYTPRETDEVSGILADLVRRETHGFSMHFARTLVSQLSDEISMIKNPHRFAGFQVLRAPDVPSVLLELGYLSNSQDEKQLRDADWRAKAAEGIAAAISKFAAGRNGAGG